MGFLDDLKALLRREARDAREWADDVVRDGNAELDRAERRLSDDPDERMAANLEDIAAGEDAFEAIRAKAEGASAEPSARAEVVEVERGSSSEPAPTHGDEGREDDSPGPRGG